METTLNSATSVATTKTYDNLTYAQKNKYNTLHRIFGDETLDLVLKIEGRGENSFIKVLQKISEIEKADKAAQKYHNALYEAFELGELYTPQEIIGIVTEVRRDLDLAPYVSRINKHCEKDFFRLFIVDNVYENAVNPDDKRTLKGYSPSFKLQTED